MARSGGATVLITLADVEPAVRLNALLEAAGITTSVVSAVDNLSTEIRRTRPELIVLTGNIAGEHDQLWSSTPNLRGKIVHCRDDRGCDASSLQQCVQSYRGLDIRECYENGGATATCHAHSRVL